MLVLKHIQNTAQLPDNFHVHFFPLRKFTFVYVTA